MSSTDRGMTTASNGFGPMCSEFSRLGTYNGFQAPLGVWPLQLAQAGFCRDRTCNDFEVVCFSCGLKLDVRSLPRQPVLGIHQTMAPSCSFVMGSSMNQPVSLASLSGASQLRMNQDLNSSGTFYLPNWGSSRSQFPAFSSLPHISESFPQASLSQVSESLPHYSSLPALGGPGQTLSSDTLEPSVLPSLPSDFLTNFQNELFLTSEVLPDVLLEGDSNHQSLADSYSGYGGSSHSPSEGRGTAYFSQSNTGTVLGGPGEVMVTDGESMESKHDAYVVEAAPGEVQAPGITPPSAVTQSAATPSEPPATKKVVPGDLGIVTQRPKHQDYAKVQDRLATFSSAWKKEGQYQTKEIMAEAGFYYTGYTDCCRCFYCGGALKNWEKEDHPWIEHCRWFKIPCPYAILNLGRDFVEAVQSLNRPNLKISLSDVEEEMKRLNPEAHQTTSTSEAVSSLQRQDSNDSIDFEDLEDVAELAKAAKLLESENAALRQQNICKVCLDKEVNVLYVPCGHLATCSICGPSVSDCPVCWQRVRGQVRVTLDA